MHCSSAVVISWLGFSANHHLATLGHFVLRSTSKNGRMGVNGSTIGKGCVRLSMKMEAMNPCTLCNRAHPG